MLGIKLIGRTLVVEQRGGTITEVHFNTRGDAVAIRIKSNGANSALIWKLKDKRSPWPKAKVLGQTDFWATLRSALRVSVGS